MKALILAAGTGSRLVNLTRDLPKALVQVKGRPLIDYVLKFVDAIPCEQIIVVGGFYYNKLADFVAGHPVEVTLIENKDFLKGNIFTLTCALAFLDDSFILLNVDHIYPLRIARRIATQMSETTEVTAVVDFDRPLGDDDMKVLIKGKHEIAKISKGLHEYDAGYVGITVVPGNRLEIYKQAAFEIARENENAVAESILARLVSQGTAPHFFDISGNRWLEIDNLSDLQNAERILKWLPDYLD